ncbi:hypothetical protein ACHHYP_03762 [Achlya hypogyna]|uniref:Uncharacterized protein n=1 Tax=Achlya hypogyna TaxID=1202772 RepID=A0A1V9ZPP2_ACHHY|nr:hypothetical protein ACHHYP_03762 [Achlya hypogyna]
MDFLVCSGTAMSEKTKAKQAQYKAPRVIRRSPRPEASVEQVTVGVRQLYTKKTATMAKLHQRRVYQSPRERVQSSKNHYDLGLTTQPTAPTLSPTPAEEVQNNASPPRPLTGSKSDSHVLALSNQVADDSARSALTSPSSLDRAAFERSLQGFQVHVEELPESVYFPPMSPIGPWMEQSYSAPPVAAAEPLSPRSRLLSVSATEMRPWAPELKRCSSAATRKKPKARRPRSSQPNDPDPDLL